VATIESYETSTGAKRYMVRYRTPNRTQTKKRGFKTKRDATEFAATVEVEKMTGAYVAHGLGMVTVGELAPAWLSRKESDVAKSNYRMLESLGGSTSSRCGDRPGSPMLTSMRWSGGSPPCVESRLLPLSSEPVACWRAFSMTLLRLDGWQSTRLAVWRICRTRQASGGCI
jgi:Arm DNA-binding domain